MNQIEQENTPENVAPSRNRPKTKSTPAVLQHSTLAGNSARKPLELMAPTSLVTVSSSAEEKFKRELAKKEATIEKQNDTIEKQRQENLLLRQQLLSFQKKEKELELIERDDQRVMPEFFHTLRYEPSRIRRIHELTQERDTYKQRCEESERQNRELSGHLNQEALRNQPHRIRKLHQLVAQLNEYRALTEELKMENADLHSELLHQRMVDKDYYISTSQE